MGWRVSWRLKVDHSPVEQTVAWSSTGQNPMLLSIPRGGSARRLTSYVRWRVTTSLYRSKLRQKKVTAIKSISIPRLELMTAVLGVKLAETVSETLEISLSQHTLWTDSVDVIYWIQGQSRRLKSFVANLVARIQRKTNPAQWRHVPGEQSPAHDAIRGLDLRNLSAESRWFQRPTFVHEGETFLNICKF